MPNLHQNGTDINTSTPIAIGSNYATVANPHQCSTNGNYPRADTVVNYYSTPVEATAYVNTHNTDDSPPSLPLPSDQV
jgi:hypothetical protein